MEEDYKITHFNFFISMKSIKSPLLSMKLDWFNVNAAKIEIEKKLPTFIFSNKLDCVTMLNEVAIDIHYIPESFDT